MRADREEHDLARLSAIAADERMAAGFALGIARQDGDSTGCSVSPAVPGPCARSLDDDGVVAAAALAAERKTFAAIAVIDSVQFQGVSKVQANAPA